MVIILQNEKIKPDVSTEDQAILSSGVTDLLLHAIATADFFAPVPPKNVMSTQTAMRLVELALATRNDVLVENVLQRLTDTTGAAPAVVQNRAREVLLPLVPLLDAKLKERPADMPPVAGVQEFYEAVVQVFAGSMGAGAGPTTSDLMMLMDVCVIHGGVDALNNQWVHTHDSDHRTDPCTQNMACLEDIEVSSERIRRLHHTTAEIWRPASSFLCRRLSCFYHHRRGSAGHSRDTVQSVYRCSQLQLLPLRGPSCGKPRKPIEDSRASASVYHNRKPTIGWLGLQTTFGPVIPQARVYRLRARTLPLRSPAVLDHQPHLSDG